MTEPSSAPHSAPQSLALNARAVAMLKAMGVAWRWPSPGAATGQEGHAERAVHPTPAAVGAPALAQAPVQSAVQSAVAPSTPHDAQGSRSAPTHFGATSAPRTHTPALKSGPVDSPTSVPASAGAKAPTTVIELKDVSWDQAAERVLQCNACGLHEARLGTEWGQGERRARWLFVTSGLHSGDLGAGTVQGQEMALLRSMWQAMGVPEVDVFVTSLTKCRPALGKAAAPEEVNTCLAYLKHQHEWLQPDMVVAMGLPVAHALWGASSQALAQWRGQVREWQGSPAIVTYPLDALLRRPVDQTKAWADLCQALDHVAQATTE